LSSSSAGDYIVKGIDSNVFGITTGALGFVSVAANSVFENNSKNFWKLIFIWLMLLCNNIL